MKTKTHWIIPGLLACIMVLTVATAMQIPASDKATKSKSIDKVGDDMILNPPGLEKIVFVHYKKGYVRPPGVGNAKKDPVC